MKIALFVLFVLITGLSFMCGLAMGQGNPEIKFIEIDMEVIRTSFELHGIEECGLDIDGNLFFYRGQTRIPNPDRQRGCFVLNNKFRNFFAEKMEEK